MAKLRFNKAKRDVAKAVLKERGQEFTSLVVDNLANQRYFDKTASKVTASWADGKANLGTRMSPDPRNGYQHHVRFVPLGGSSSPDTALTSKQRQTKYNNQVNPYKVSIRVPHETKEVKVRTGTTPPRTVMIKDKVTGHEHPIRIGSKPKYGSVGSKPKDGGQDW